MNPRDLIPSFHPGYRFLTEATRGFFVPAGTISLIHYCAAAGKRAELRLERGSHNTPSAAVCGKCGIALVEEEPNNAQLRALALELSGAPAP